MTKKSKPKKPSSNPPNLNPPEPPEVPRRVSLPPNQIVGVVLMLILPILAAFGAFGESFGEVEASGSDVRLSASYPSRLRLELNSNLQVTVQNTGQQTLDTLAVHFERDYLDQFANLSFAPSVTEATSSAYIVELHDLAPGATQTVMVQLTGEQYGSHKGRIWASVDDRTAAELNVSSVVFP